ncbi:VanZ family protein [Aureimonas frigidaquae]|uniref:VanZ family protein n=1 Tax=Aureimonas frigidaquae TaxID=424757 RepID=UPI000780E313|nr:VanZ family protein [Aureimonas frigidaquae]
MLSLIRLAAWLALGAVIFVTLSPISMRPVSSADVDIERLAAFVVLGGLFGAGYPRRWPLVLLLLIAGGAGLELSQNLVPGRHGRVEDFLFKAGGAVLGAGLGVVAIRLLSRLRARP